MTTTLGRVGFGFELLRRVFPALRRCRDLALDTLRLAFGFLGVDGHGLRSCRRGFLLVDRWCLPLLIDVVLGNVLLVRSLLGLRGLLPGCRKRGFGLRGCRVARLFPGRFGGTWVEVRVLFDVLRIRKSRKSD